MLFVIDTLCELSDLVPFSDYANLNAALNAFHFVFLSTPGNARSTCIALWLVRIVTFSLLLRTYLVPWLLALMSDHIRIRSISFRSVRGIYFRQGLRTWKVERIGYVWSTQQGSRRFALKIDGVNLQVAKEEDLNIQKRKPRRNRRFTLSFLRPPRLAQRLWRFLASISKTFEPYVRPLARTVLIGLLRVLIQWLPRILQALSFDLQSAIITFADVPGAQILIEEINLSSALVLTQLNPTPIPTDSSKTRKQGTDGSGSGVAAWRKRMTDSFRRSLDNAWGEARGDATVTLKISNVVGTMPAPGNESHNVPFLLSPGTTDLTISAKFNPREGSIDHKSLQVSFRLGDCSAKIDLLKYLVDKALPKKVRKPVASPPDPLPLTPLGSPPATAASFASQASAYLTSPVQSLASSVFSSKTFFTSTGIKSPISGILSPKSAASPGTIKSPASPFLKAISASMRLRRRYTIPPPARLKDQKAISVLSILRSVSVSVGSINLSLSSSAMMGPYKVVIQDIGLDISSSHPTSHDLHKHHLGKYARSDDSEPESYALKVHLGQMALEREKPQHVVRLIKIGPVAGEVLAHQWPAPFIQPSPFLSHDPNAPLLAACLKVSSIQMTERLQDFTLLMLALQNYEGLTSTDAMAPSHQAIPSLRMDLPRVSMVFECGPIASRIIYDADNGRKHHAIELRSNGIACTLDSVYQVASSAISRSFARASIIQPLHSTSRLSCNVEPVLIRVRSKFFGASDEIGHPSDPDFLNDPPVLSIGLVEVNGIINGVGQIDSSGPSIASVDKTSLGGNLSVGVDSLCLELWHPMAVDASLQLLTIIPPRKAPPSASKGFAKLPMGVEARFAIGRVMGFITAPDVTPEDNLELSRGFSVRSTIALEYCGLFPSNIQWFDDVKQIRKRVLLRLNQGLSRDAIAASKMLGLPADRVALVRLRSGKLILRSGVATEYEPDEPVIAGRDAPFNDIQEFVHVHDISVDARLSHKTLPGQSAPMSTCEVEVDVPLILADLHISHIYSLLLGLQTLRLLFPPKDAATATPKPKAANAITYLIQGNITSTQILCKLPTQTLVVCIDKLGLLAAPAVQPRVLFSKATFFASLTPKVASREDFTSPEWGEFLTLVSWELSVAAEEKPVSINIEGEKGRLHIPYGFVLADLLHDVSVVIKAIKHIAHMASAGCYSPMPFPEPEGPKSIPQIILRLDSLVVEAQDDPFESRLGMIWQAGAEAIKQRIDREDAFKSKVAAILAAENGEALQQTRGPGEQEYHFTSKHSVSIEEARRRLDDVHVLDWTLRLENKRKQRRKTEISMLHLGSTAKDSGYFTVHSLAHLSLTSATTSDPPLLKANLNDLCLTITPPSFSLDRLSDVLFDYGGGLPRDTEFSLLVPLHIHFTLSSANITLRDYPIPLLAISPPESGSTVSWTFETDLIVAEEMGTEHSVDWVPCHILEPAETRHGEAPFSILVPKTIMPVKTYARPTIHIRSTDPTTLSWAVSYTPALQDVMKVLDTLTSPPRDPSPSLGFWDKLRLIMHWTVRVTFSGDIHFYMKGTRDPYQVTDAGAGFVLCWQGHPEIRVGYDNYQKELVQVLSDDMLIAVPNLQRFVSPSARKPKKPKYFLKVGARLTSGVRFGVGFVLERACGLECAHCTGTPFHRKCRYFSSRPHWEVRLEKKALTPRYGSPEDSFTGFRSDFVHLSVSLASGTRGRDGKSDLKTSNLYLTPKIFAHFWAWCQLFEGSLSLPVRQGRYWPPRPISPKFGRHLATIKYRISLLDLYAMHGYMDDSRESWADGITPWVGVKGKIDEFQADLHQRDEEHTISGPLPNTTRVVRKKPFYAAEVMIKALELRALLATFSDPLKSEVDMEAPTQRSNYRNHLNLPETQSSSPWHDLDDFVELDWTPSSSVVLNLMPLAHCPHFTYFKQSTETSNNSLHPNKFGSENSHICLLGKEPTITSTQIQLASKRLAELKSQMQTLTAKDSKLAEVRSLTKTIALVEEYIAALTDNEINPDRVRKQDTQHYYLLPDMKLAEKWSEFENVYQLHCPSIFLNGSVRDIMMKYYYCSRDRRGFEYHMSQRAVQFILDQADATVSVEDGKDRPSSTAQLATAALRKFLKSDSPKVSVELAREKSGQTPIDPLNGWANGVQLRKSHRCTLLKPQIVLRGEAPADTCILAASQATAQSFAIMDLDNLDDPVSGKVMSRNYTSVSGLQCFAPTDGGALANMSKHGTVPLEVLIDLRCENQTFERLVPQTEASFQYDKFNRLRLRNRVTSVKTRAHTQDSSMSDSHLQDQTDLVRVNIPRFTVSANAEHFHAISNIVTKLLLVSDPSHKTRLDRLETMVFTYDFTDLASAAAVVTSIQGRLRDALESERISLKNPRRLEDDQTRLSLLQLQAHIFLLGEELNMLFDAIKLAQDRSDDHTDQKSALLLHASSSEISWRMLDARRNLISKLVVAQINFNWLSRADSSTVNQLTVGNLTAFDGSRHATWAEILSKHDEPANHPLLKKGLFLLANWIILPPVGGITIYECFELSLHPIRLQIDAKVGRRIMEYVWPERKERQQSRSDTMDSEVSVEPSVKIEVNSPVRSSLDSPRALHSPRTSPTTAKSLVLPLRKLGNSRSFTDLRSAKESSAASSNHAALLTPTFIHRSNSTHSLNLFDPPTPKHTFDGDLTELMRKRDHDEAQVMKTRSTQKTFILVKVASINVLLSVVKEGSFECHDAQIKTKELEYKNQTWSFEELVSQFIPTDMSWRGWVKMAFHQPLLPVLPVARELLSKTRWGASKPAAQHSVLHMLHPRVISPLDDDIHLQLAQAESSRSPDRKTSRKNTTSKGGAVAEPVVLTSGPLTAEPESLPSSPPNSAERPSLTGRNRMKSLFGSKHRTKTGERRSDDSIS